MLNKQWVSEQLILKVNAGSKSYGTETEESDEDYRGICIPPGSYLLGLDQFEQQECSEPDEVIYSLQKFVKLALDNNPNILDVLFVDEKDVVFVNEFGKELRDLRYLFLSKRVFKTYGGYAYSQFNKLTSLSKNADGKRATTIEKFGYDTKGAMHLVRLLTMANEILTEGEVIVHRPDRAYLLDIRKGTYSLDEIKERYRELDEKIIEANKNTTLPEEPNYQKVNEWLVSAHKRSLDFAGWN